MFLLLLSAIHFAVRADQVAMVKCLLEMGVSPNLQDGKGDSPLHIACSGHFPDCALTLLSAGARFTAKNNAGLTPLQLATSEFAADLIDAIRSRAQQQQSSSSSSAHPAAAQKGKSEKKAKPAVAAAAAASSSSSSAEGEESEQAALFELANVTDPKGETFLIRACKDGSMRLATVMLELGADVMDTGSASHGSAISSFYIPVPPSCLSDQNSPCETHHFSPLY